jgi:hypothetical protein
MTAYYRLPYNHTTNFNSTKVHGAGVKNQLGHLDPLLFVMRGTLIEELILFERGRRTTYTSTK